MKKIVGDILKNKNIDNNLAAYCGEYMALNSKYAYIRLAMNYYTYYMMMSEDAEILHANQRDMMMQIHQIVERGIKEDVIEADIEALETIRTQIIGSVQDITCYVDRFNIYEHALNRVEYRFRQEELPKGYSDENLTRELMRFILADEEQMSVNRKIRQVVGQLPIRFTKNKFYELLSN